MAKKARKGVNRQDLGLVVVASQCEKEGRKKREREI